MKITSADLENDNRKPPIAVVVNAGSGADDKNDVLGQLKELFAERKIAARFFLIENGADFDEALKQIVAGDAEIVVAGGGDGTISAVAAAILPTNKILGVLPLGTLNHFSKDLQIPQDLPAAIDIIAENYQTQIDVGEVNGEIFINNSSLGLYPRIVRRRVKQQSFGYRKWTAFFWAALSVFRRYPFLDLKMKIERQYLERRTPVIFIGNNEYELHAYNLGGRHSLQEGILSVYVLHRTGRLGLLLLGLRSLFGTVRDAEDFDEFLTDEIVIEKRRKKRKRTLVALDGEVKVMESPIRYRILPGALRVIVPKAENK